MSDAVSKAMDRLLVRLNDPLHQAAEANIASLIVEFRDIEREWKQALKPALLQSDLKRLGAEIEKHEGLLSDEAVAAQVAGQSWEYIVGKSGRLMTIRRKIERENP